MTELEERIEVEQLANEERRAEQSAAEAGGAGAAGWAGGRGGEGASGHQNGGGGRGRGLHSSTSQLNLSRVWSLSHMHSPLLSLTSDDFPNNINTSRHVH